MVGGNAASVGRARPGRPVGGGCTAKSRRFYPCQDGRRASNIVSRAMSMKKRILQIIPTLDRAGAEKQLCLLAEGLPRDEFEVHVCALTRGGPLETRLP